MQYIKNVTVFRSGYQYNQKTGQGSLVLILEGFDKDYRVEIQDTSNLNKLFEVFGMGERDILWLNSLKRNHCRLVLEEDEPIAIRHIMNDNLEWRIQKSENIKVIP